LEEALDPVQAAAEFGHVGGFDRLPPPATELAVEQLNLLGEGRPDELVGRLWPGPPVRFRPTGIDPGGRRCTIHSVCTRSV
jgi:hypothetical protein